MPFNGLITSNIHSYPVSLPAQTLDDTVAAATKLGLVVRVPTARELFLDIDSREDYDSFLSLMPMLPGVMGWSKTPSKSGYPKCHVVVVMCRDVTPEERILLQACLGSDRKREILSYIRLKDGNRTPSVFFEKR